VRLCYGLTLPTSLVKPDPKNSTSPRKENIDKPRTNSQNLVCGTEEDWKGDELDNVITLNNPLIMTYKLAKKGSG